MKTSRASVVDLKTHMGRYLALVKRGETVVVTSHRHPVARLTGVEVSTDALPIIPPDRPVKDLNEIVPIGFLDGVDGVDMLLADRKRR